MPTQIGVLDAGASHGAQKSVTECPGIGGPRRCPKQVARRAELSERRIHTQRRLLAEREGLLQLQRLHVARVQKARRAVLQLHERTEPCVADRHFVADEGREILWRFCPAPRSKAALAELDAAAEDVLVALAEGAG